MVDWRDQNVRDRASYDAICEADRTASAELCPFCGVPGCPSPFCEMARRKVEQQAKAQVLSARDGVTGDAR